MGTKKVARTGKAAVLLAQGQCHEAALCPEAIGAWLLPSLLAGGSRWLSPSPGLRVPTAHRSRPGSRAGQRGAAVDMQAPRAMAWGHLAGEWGKGGFGGDTEGWL